MHMGRIKSYCKNAGDGLIAPCDGTRDVYFTRHVVEGNSRWIAVGVKVEYTLQDSGNGSPRASEVRKYKKV